MESLSREVIASQSVPGWSASCPLTDGSSTEFSTIYTVLKDAQAISNTMGQEDTLSNSIWSYYLCEGQANTVEACKQVFRCCDSNGYVSYRIELLGDYWQKVPKLGPWRSADREPYSQSSASLYKSWMKASTDSPSNWCRLSNEIFVLSNCGEHRNNYWKQCELLHM